MVTLSEFDDPVEALWITCSQNFLDYLVFYPFDSERVTNYYILPMIVKFFVKMLMLYIYMY
jgi:hypothetical protein